MAEYFGFYRGIVTDNNDPQKSGMIKATVPSILGDDVETAWCDPGFYMAVDREDGASDFQVPAVGAGVWISFEEGDIDDPIYFGGWFSEDATPLTEYENPDKVRIIGKGDSYIFMYEDKIDFTIQGNNVIEIEKDKVTINDRLDVDRIFLAGTELDPNGSQKGDPGATFIPHISSDGILSWTNDGGLDNPSPVLIVGPAGKDGEPGKDGGIGPQGPIGLTGARGVTYTPTVSSSGIISWVNDGGLTNPTPVNIKGADGEIGPQGQAGKDGADGAKGDSGDDGATFIPSVSPEGVISWTNTAGMSNPDPVDIKGPQGEAGAEYWHLTPDNSYVTTDYDILLEDDHRIYLGETKSKYYYGDNDSIVFGGKGIILRPETNVDNTSQLGTDTIPWHTSHITNMETYSNADASYFNVGDAIDALKVGKADLGSDGKVLASQLPDDIGKQWNEIGTSLYSTNRNVMILNRLVVGASGANSLNGDSQFQLRLYSPSIAGNYISAGIDNNGKARFFANSANINGIYFNTHLNPDSDETYNLGSLNNRWKGGYFSDDVRIGELSVKDSFSSKADLDENGWLLESQIPYSLQDMWTKGDANDMSTGREVHATKIYISGEDVLQKINRKVSYDQYGLVESDAIPLFVKPMYYVNSSVNYIWDDDTRDGTILRPFKTINDALAAINDSEGSIINVAPGTYTEDIDMTGKQNVAIITDIVAGEWRTIIDGDITVASTSQAFSIKGFRILGTLRHSTLGTCSIESCRISKVLLNESGVGNLIIEFSLFINDFTVTGSTDFHVEMLDCVFGEACTCNIDGGENTFIDCRDVEITSHTRGRIRSLGNTNFTSKAGNGYCIISTANTSSGAWVYLLGGTTLSDTYYLPILKTGDCPWRIGNFTREPTIDTLSGPRLDGGGHIEDSYYHYTPLNYTKISGSDLMPNHIRGIDAELGIIKSQIGNGQWDDSVSGRLSTDKAVYTSGTIYAGTRLSVGGGTDNLANFPVTFKRTDYPQYEGRFGFSSIGEMLLYNTSTSGTIFNNNIMGNVDAYYDLGKTSRQWKNLYVSNDVILNGSSVNGRITALENGGGGDAYWELSDSTLIAKKPDGGIVGIDVSNNSYFRSNTYITNGRYLTFYYAGDSSGGNGNIQADSTSLRFATSGDIVDFKFVGPVMPGVNNRYDFGSTDRQWNNGYFKTLTTQGNIRSSGQIAVFADPSSTDTYLQLTSTDSSYAVIRTDNRGVELRGVTYFGPYSNNFTSLGQTNYRFTDAFISGDVYIGASNTANGVNARLTSLESSIGYARLDIDTSTTDYLSFTMADNQLPAGVNVLMNSDGEIVITKSIGRPMSYHITGTVDWRLPYIDANNPDATNWFVGELIGGDSVVPFSVSEVGQRYWDTIPIKCTGTVNAASSARFIKLEVSGHSVGPEGLTGSPMYGSITIEVRLQ